MYGMRCRTDVMGIRIIVIFISCASLIGAHIIKTSAASQNEMHVRVKFPSGVKEGDNATLTCEYNLKGKPLYSIRWFFNGDEVYRYTMRPKQIKKVSPVDGITVDVSSLIPVQSFNASLSFLPRVSFVFGSQMESSTRDSLTLRNIAKPGQFLCEVTEYDMFTSSRSGDRLNVTMTSSSSSHLSPYRDCFPNILLLLVVKSIFFMTLPFINICY